MLLKTDHYFEVGHRKIVELRPSRPHRPSIIPKGMWPVYGHSSKVLLLTVLRDTKLYTTPGNYSTTIRTNNMNSEAHTFKGREVLLLIRHGNYTLTNCCL